MVWGELPIAPMVCRVGTGGLGLGAPWQGRYWLPPLPQGGLGAGHHGARIQSRPSSMLRKVQEDGISLQPSLSGFQLDFQLGLRDGNPGAFSPIPPP